MRRARAKPVRAYEQLNGTNKQWFRIVRANQIKSEQVAGAPAMPATFTPATGLGAALAALPPPWAVFRRGGISPFDSTGKEIYGGLYIAFHPERGIALIDVAPARPDRAVPRLVGLLRQAGLQEFSDAQPPIISLVIGRGELRQAALRLGKAFETAPIIRNHGWTKTAITALLAQFPDLQQVQRAGEAPEGKTAAEADAEAAAAAGPPPAESATASAPAAADYEIPQMPTPPAARAEPARPPVPPPQPAAGPERPTLAGADPRLDSVDHRIRSFDPEPGFWEEWLPSRRYLPGVAIGVAVIAAVIILLLRSGTPPAPGTNAPTASNGAVETAPSAPAPAPPPEQAATTAPATTAAPVPPPVPPPAATVAAPSSAPAGQAAAPSAPGGSGTSATPALPPQAPPQQTATVTPPASPPPAQAVTPPTPPLVKVPATKEAARPAEPAAKKAAKPKASDTATREDRARRPAEQPAAPAAPAEDTVTIDGMTYVKGREPHMLGETAAPAPDAGATVTPAPAPTPPPQDHSQDVTPGSITVSPGSASQGMPP